MCSNGLDHFNVKTDGYGRKPTLNSILSTISTSHCSITNKKTEVVVVADSQAVKTWKRR